MFGVEQNINLIVLNIVHSNHILQGEQSRFKSDRDERMSSIAGA